MSRPDWLVVGAEVGTYSPSDFASVKASTITKIGKRDVVLADGQRFNVNSLSRSAGTWGRTTYLTAANDPRFVRAQAEQYRRNVSRRLGQYAQELRGAKDDEAAEKALDLLTRYLSRGAA